MNEAAIDVLDGAEAVTLHFVRLTLEAKTPLSIGSGRVHKRRRQVRDRQTGQPREEIVEAAGIIRDANGLPTIPGSGYQGVLRRLCAACDGADLARMLFGVEDGPDTGSAGRLICGWGFVHNQRDEAVRGLDLGPSDDDPVLGLLKQPAPGWRDHVALNARHSVDERKKFARAYVPPGARFSLELAAWGDEAMGRDLIAAARLFGHPSFRLGGATKRGYGRLAVLRASYSAPDLADPARLREIRQQAPSTPLPRDLMADEAFRAPAATATGATIHLTLRDFFRIGATTDDARTITQGTYGVRDARTGEAQSPTEPANLDVRRKRDNTLAILRETWIVYENGLGRFVELAKTDETSSVLPNEGLRFPVPASAIKGTLAHRMAFYANKNAQRTIDVDAWLALPIEEQDAQLAAMEMRPAALHGLLGTAKGPAMRRRGPTPGSASRMIVNDCEALATEWIIAIDHASIDRFAGGARDQTGALFAEEVLLGAKLSIEITIDRPARPAAAGEPTIGGWPETAAKPLLQAMRDLCRGRLPIGARSLGTCDGTVAWQGPEAAAWRAAAVQVGVPLAEGERP